MISRSIRTLFSAALLVAVGVAFVGCAKPMPLAKAEVSMSIDKPYHDAGSSPYLTVQVTNPNAEEMVVAPLSSTSVTVYYSAFDPETGKNTPKGQLRFVDEMSAADGSAYLLAGGASDDHTFQVESLPTEPGEYHLVAKYSNNTSKGRASSVSGLVSITVE